MTRHTTSATLTSERTYLYLSHTFACRGAPIMVANGCSFLESSSHSRKGYVNRPLHDSYGSVISLRVGHVPHTAVSAYSVGTACGQRSDSVSKSIAIRNRTVLIVALILALTTLIASTVLLQTALANEASGAPSVQQQSVTVLPGDTVWGICESNPVEGLSTYEMVQQVLDMNKKADATIIPGERLVLPTE